MLRQKANYGILEGFISALLKRDVHILSIPESEANALYAKDKINKIDILCESTTNELILIELQYNSENDYFQRMLFGASKILIDFMEEGYNYGQLRKVYSINIVYFDFGQGTDYVYHGTTNFHGIHHGDKLQLNEGQRNLLKKDLVFEIYPEYYVLKINKFDDIAKEPLDEWIYYFKHNDLPPHFMAKGLTMVQNKLIVEKMDSTSKIEYEAYLKELAISKSVLSTAQIEGRIEGKVEGRIEGRIAGKVEGESEEKKKVVIRAFENQFPIPMIAKLVSLPEEDVIRILHDEGKVLL